jgi:hypothetical protein
VLRTSVRPSVRPSVLAGMEAVAIVNRERERGSVRLSLLAEGLIWTDHARVATW